MANEVRKLAEQSARASEDAGEIVTGFEDQMRQVASQWRSAMVTPMGLTSAPKFRKIPM